VASLTTTINSLPPRDQLALKFLGYMVQAGTAPEDEREAVARAYHLSDAYLSVARESWKEAHGKADATDTERNDTTDTAQASG